MHFPVVGEMPMKKALFVAEYTKDFSPRRAAEAVGLSPERGYDLVNNDEEVREAISKVIAYRQDCSDVDAEWVLQEMVDNHYIARQHGNLAASNSALGMIAKHKGVDAMASAQLNVNLDIDKEVLERLQKGRARVAGVVDAVVVTDEPSIPEDDKPVSFM